MSNIWNVLPKTRVALSNTICVTIATGTAHLSGALCVHSRTLRGVRVAPALVSCVVLYRPLFVYLSFLFYFWPLHYMCFFNVRFLIVPFVSLNVS
jgi:hypothetical protein